MSSKSTETLSADSGQKEKNSVYDYLYYDARRIGSFLGQVDPSGALQSLKQSSQMGKSESAKATLAGKAGVGVASVQSATEDEAASQFSKAIERTYDPFWGNARNLLNYLAANDLIQEDLAKAVLGSFVLAKGSLSVLDLGMLKEAWKLPTVKRLVGLGAEQAQGLSRQQRRQADRQGNKEPNPQSL